jgi:hypothetical protein
MEALYLLVDPHLNPALFMLRAIAANATSSPN